MMAGRISVQQTQKTSGNTISIHIFFFNIFSLLFNIISVDKHVLFLYCIASIKGMNFSVRKKTKQYTSNEDQKSDKKEKIGLLEQ